METFEVVHAEHYILAKSINTLEEAKQVRKEWLRYFEGEESRIRIDKLTREEVK